MKCKKCNAALVWDFANYCYMPTGYDPYVDDEPTCVDGSYHSEHRLAPPLSVYSSRFLTETDEGNAILLGGRV